MSDLISAEKMIDALMKLDRQCMQTFGAWSHAAAHCSERVQAIAANPDATGRGAKACRDIVKDAQQKLDTVLEMIDDTSLDARRAKLVAEIEAAGITSGCYGGFAVLMAGRFIQQAIRDLCVCRAAIHNGTSPKWGRERGAELVAELRARGIDASEYLPAE